MINRTSRNVHLPPRGFTLVEIAIVMVLATLVLGAVLVPLAGQIETRRVAQARDEIEQMKEAILGFAAANGRLPCPASATSNGQESFCTIGSPASACVATTSPQTHGRCSNFLDGYLPAAALGISPIDSSGYALDPWDTPASRWRYAVSNLNEEEINGVTYALTATNGMRTATISEIVTRDLLFVCARGGASSSSTNCGTGITALTTKAPAVVWSLGRNANTAGASSDEQENVDGDRFFVSRDIAVSDSPNGEFDDQVGWLSSHILFSRMLTAGQL